MNAAAAIVALAAGLASLRVAAVVFLPLAVSYFIAVLLEPLVAAGERRGLPRKLGSVLAVLLFLTVVAGGIALLAQPFARLYGSLPQYEQKLRAARTDFERKEQAVLRQAQSFAGEPETPAEGPAQSQRAPMGWSKLALAGLGSLAEALGIAVFVPFLILFMLIEKAGLLRAADTLLSKRFDAALIINETARMVRAYFLGNLIVAVFLGALQTAIFAAIGLQNPLGLGIITGLFNVVPILGLPFAAGMPVLQGLVQALSPTRLWAIAGVVTAIHFFVANFVEPRWIANRVKLNSFAATLGMLFWGWGWGVVGFLLAIPIMAQARIVLESRPATQPWARLLAEISRKDQGLR